VEPARKINDVASRLADRMHQPSAALAAQASGVGPADRPLQTSFVNAPWFKVLAIVLVVMFPFVTYAVGRRASGQEGTPRESELALAPSADDEGPTGPVEEGPAFAVDPSPSPTPAADPTPDPAPPAAEVLDAEAEKKAQAPRAPLARCADGKDNDGDGRKDFPADKGCSSTGDTTESSEAAPTAAKPAARTASSRAAAPPPAPAPAPPAAAPGPVTQHVTCSTSSTTVVVDGRVAEQKEETCSDGSRKPVGQPVFKSHCEDGLDNDSDGKTDRDDPGCETLADNSEADPTPPTPKPQCDDGDDNDGDGTVDMMDTGCSSATDSTEGEPAPPATTDCTDGLDNDGDGLVDGADPGCRTGAGSLETPFNVQCSDGVDNDGDGFLDMADPQCSTIQDTSELPADPLPACKDGLDNDGDTLVDLVDPECVGNPNHPSEA
jgi:hypothetical protein